MFGGNVVTISGPCFAGGQDIVCRFKDINTPGMYIGNMMKVGKYNIELHSVIILNSIIFNP
jgi:hypothetical protein